MLWTKQTTLAIKSVKIQSCFFFIVADVKAKTDNT